MSTWSGQTLGSTVEWTLDDIGKPEKVVTIRLPYDPLAAVIALLELNYDMSTIYSLIRSEMQQELLQQSAGLEITTEHVEQARKVRTYFKNRMIFRRLQDQPISDFMRKLERILEYELSIDSDCIAVLVRMPEFYQQNVDTSEIFKRSVSMPGLIGHPITIDSPIKLEGKVVYSDKKPSVTTYYWRTKDDFLIAVNVGMGTALHAPWQFISQLENIAISGDFVVSTKAGYDFKLARPFGGRYELYNT